LNNRRIFLSCGDPSGDFHAARLVPELRKRNAVVHALGGRRTEAAGAELLETNSFGANRPKLQHYGLEAHVREFNLAAATLAREAAGDPEGASAWRRQLREEYPETPWARRLEPPAGPSPRR